MSTNSTIYNVSSNKVLKRKKSSLTEIKVTILGEKNVGKTAFVVRFITKRFIMEYEHGIDKRYKHELLIDNEPIIFDILDTSNSTDSSLTNVDCHMNCGDVLLLIYSITDRQSFNHIRTLLRNIAQCKSKNTNCNLITPLVAIVANKSDLIHLRQVSREEGEILCHENSDLTTIYLGEYSAADMQLQTMFIEMFKWLKRHRNINKTIPSLLDRMVIGIKATANGAYN